MKTYQIFLIVFVVACLMVPAFAVSDIEVTKNLTSMPLTFTENQGQWDEKVKFRANAGGATMWFSSDGAYYQFTRTIETDPISVVDKRYGMLSDDMAVGQPDSVETMMIKANFVGANLNPQMVGLDMIEYKCNYFIGNDPNNWHTDVANYSAVMYEEIYDGIDLKYYGNGKQMEYDFIVSPGVDYSQIKIQYEGAESISVNTSGELVVETMWGEVVEQKPVIYQIENGSRIAVSGDYDIKGTSAFGFELSDYNPALPLVIDPALVYSTYLGGSDIDLVNCIDVDASGAVYVAGMTESTDFPTLNPFQNSLLGLRDAFVTKFSSSGNSLIYSTYLGGSGYEGGASITVDASGVVYVTGFTNSTNFPTTLNPYQGTNQGGGEIFVTKLSSSGNNLIYSTYLGGSGNDNSNDIAIDASGMAYLTGSTSSTNFPILNPYQGTNQGGGEIFVTKLSSSGNNLIYSTYLGGSGNDVSRGIAIDASGAAYVTGGTYSTNFPTQNAYYSTFQGGQSDAFVTKLSSTGSSLIYSTYLGGSSTGGGGYTENAYDIDIDVIGAAYVTGVTPSTDFPTHNAFQSTYQGGPSDAFVTKLSSSGNSLVYSTYLGGGIDVDGEGDPSAAWDLGTGIAVDVHGFACVTGFTWCRDFPTEDPYQAINNGLDEIFVTKFNYEGDNLIYSTYFGGNADDRCLDIAINDYGAVYITGYTYSVDFPLQDPYQDTYAGNPDDLWQGFVAKFSHEFDPACCALRGDVAIPKDGSVLMNDAVFLVDFVFRGGPPPECLEEGDCAVPLDGQILVNDLTWVINYLLYGGPPPPPCF